MPASRDDTPRDPLRESDAQRVTNKMIFLEIAEVKKEQKIFNQMLVEGKIMLKKDCLLCHDEPNQPVRQKEFNRLDKRVWWITGLVITLIGAVAALKYAVTGTF